MHLRGSLQDSASPLFLSRRVIKWPSNLQHFNRHYFYCIDHYRELLANLRRFICTALQPRRKDRACGFGRPYLDICSGGASNDMGCRWVRVFVFANRFESRKFRYSSWSMVNHRKFEEVIRMVFDCLSPTIWSGSRCPMSGPARVDHLLNYLQSPSVTQLEFKCYKGDVHPISIYRNFPTCEFCKIRW